MKHRIVLAAGSLTLLLTGGAQADEPGAIARDFCQAVAAQASCKKVFVMPKDTEQRLADLAGGPLRGKDSALKDDCNAGYNAYYALEDEKGQDAACAAALGLFGENGTQRAGLVVARAAPSGLKLPEAAIAAMATDLCYAVTVADNCPDTKLVEGIEARLDGEAGVRLREPGGYFSGECGSGAFRASLAKGKVALTEFCATSLGEYGPSGTVRAGLLTGPQTAAAAPVIVPAPGIAPPESQTLRVIQPPKDTAAKKVAPPKTGDKKAEDKEVAPGIPASALTILTDLPPLPEGKTAEDVLGFTPGARSAEACAALTGELAAESAALEAGNLADKTRTAVQLAAHIRIAASVCPGASVPEMPQAVVDAVAATGLEACHIVLEADKTLEAAGRDLQKANDFLSMIANTEGRLWALEGFAPTCSSATERSMSSKVRFAKSQLDREKEFYGCRLWQDLQRQEMDGLRVLMKDKKWVEGIALLDGRIAAVLHGAQAACGDKGSVDSMKKYWLTQRQFFQGRLIH
ncbi:MAG: hypothetical protein C0606_08325 [Hyphomicrobiales bacterium]|nr:MAG: hypothetical protein C0606_08325 [Hyphomicrobiales bacterium]